MRQEQSLSEMRFTTLAKMFALGFLGCAVITFILVFAAGVLIPNYIKTSFDMSVSTFRQIWLSYLGVILVFTAPMMLLGSWLLREDRA